MARKPNVQEMMDKLRGYRPEGVRSPAPGDSKAKPEREARLVRPRTEAKPKVEMTRPADAAAAPDGELTGRLADLLVGREKEGSRTVDLAETLGIDAIDVREELMAMERVGIVYRTGRTRGTRWFLG